MSFIFVERTPCSSCPYRQDVPTGVWDPQHFLDVLKADAEPFRGAMWGCHKYVKKEEQSFCAGWLLDQRRRNFPSIQLRLRMMTDDALARDLCEVLTDQGHTLYDSINDMCRANLFAKPRRRKRAR